MDKMTTGEIVWTWLVMGGFSLLVLLCFVFGPRSNSSSYHSTPTLSDKVQQSRTIKYGETRKAFGLD